MVERRQTAAPCPKTKGGRLPVDREPGQLQAWPPRPDPAPGSPWTCCCLEPRDLGPPEAWGGGAATSSRRGPRARAGRGWGPSWPISKCPSVPCSLVCRSFRQCSSTRTQCVSPAPQATSPTPFPPQRRADPGPTVPFLDGQKCITELINQMWFVVVPYLQVHRMNRRFTCPV